MCNIAAKLKADKRFYINEPTMNFLLNRGEISSYRLVKVPLSKIRRGYNGVYSLDSTDVYHFLEDPNNENYRQKYIEYCNIPNARKDNPDRSVETFKKLISNFNYKEYNIKDGVIVIDQFNQIMEGFHRSCILLKNKGGDYKIEVLKIVYRYKFNRGYMKMVWNNFLYDIKRSLKRKTI